jgi:hypothetical protein
VDRACPSSNCLGEFKTLWSDWCSKISEKAAFCPFCRYAAPATEWNTESQKRYINDASMAHVTGVLGRAFKADASRFNSRQPSRSFIKMSMEYRPGRNPPVLLPDASAVLRQSFTCDSCGFQYSSLGASFFCPACGDNCAATSFDSTLKTVRATTAALAAMRATLERELDADTARDAIRQILEDQFPRLVGAFERLNEALFQKHPNALSISAKGNVFQRIDDASALWFQACGRGYQDFLGQSELARLKLLYQRRHVLSHKQGIVDQVYLDRSGDTEYTVGQRLVVRETDLLELIELLNKLANELKRIS